MNAKQIADELENIYWIQGDGKGKPFQQYADFVRQQQAEIEALKKEAALQRLSDFTQEADNEPVAWIARGDNTSVFFDLDCALSIDDSPTPLYTHPAKTLTDEEIEEVFRTVEQDFALTESKKSDGGWRNFPVELGRAILRKAQEK